MKTEDVFSFGKYKGKTLKDVLAEHGNYIKWCLDNVPGFCIEPKSLQERFVKGYHNWQMAKTVRDAECQELEDDVLDRWDFS